MNFQLIEYDDRQPYEKKIQIKLNLEFMEGTRANEELTLNTVQIKENDENPMLSQP